MATTVYPLNTLSALDADGTTEYEAWTSVGDSTSPGVSEDAPSVDTSAKSYIDDANGIISWYTRPLQAVTISGSLTVNVPALESSMSANQQIGIIIDRVNSSGTYISTIYDGTKGTELSTGSIPQNWSGTPTSTSLSNGDRIRFRFYGTEIGTGATGYTVSAYFDGALGNTYITFTETLAEYTGGATTYRAHSQAQSWIESTYNVFAQVQTYIKQIYYSYAQANALIGIVVYKYAQANAWVEATYKVSSQAQAQISGIVTTITQVSQTRAQIRSTYPRSFNYSQIILNDSPVAYWRLGESSGLPQDSAGTNHCTVSGGSLTYGESGALLGDSNTAIKFNSTGYFTAPDATALDVGDVFSFEAWVKLATLGQFYPQLGTKGAGTFSIGIDTTNHPKIGVNNGADIATSTTAITNTTAFHHVVVTKDGSSVHIYLDGTDVTGTVTNSTLGTTNDPFNIGRDSGGSYNLNGWLDEVALYNYALTFEKVKVHYVAGTWGATFAQAQAQISTTATTKTTYAQALAQIYTPNLLLPIADITINDWVGVVI